jgi:hypothetical protein
MYLDEPTHKPCEHDCVIKWELEWLKEKLEDFEKFTKQKEGLKNSSRLESGEEVGRICSGHGGG